MPDRSLTENVVVVGVVVVVVVAVVVVVVNALNANAITEATASKPALIFLIPFISDSPSSLSAGGRDPFVAALIEPLPFRIINADNRNPGRIRNPEF